VKYSELPFMGYTRLLDRGKSHRAVQKYWGKGGFSVPEVRSHSSTVLQNLRHVFDLDAGIRDESPHLLLRQLWIKSLCLSKIPQGNVAGPNEFDPPRAAMPVVFVFTTTKVLGFLRTDGVDIAIIQLLM
jgi:hypothetical protein